MKRPRAVVEGASPGSSIVAGPQVIPALSSMANGCLRSLNVISENPLISIKEFEKMTQRRAGLPLEYECGPVGRGRTDHELAHVLACARAKLVPGQTQIAYREADRRKAHPA
jgi:hypothetical protein